jgi:S-adenosylmethionine decarboxylase
MWVGIRHNGELYLPVTLSQRDGTMDATHKKLKLEGFNNLTKAFSFNIYDVCYAQTLAQRREYIKYIDDAYNAQRLTRILTDVADIVGATVLNIARQDYHPQGARATSPYTPTQKVTRATASVPFAPTSML